MASTKIKIMLNTNTINQIISQERIAIEKTAEFIVSDLKNSGTMPFDTGTLQNNSTFATKYNKSSNSASIVSTTPYARRLYYHPEYNFRKTNNENAGGRWFEPYVNGNKRTNIKNAFVKFF